jgi:hypothetical protein
MSDTVPRFALYKICANKKIGESERKKEHHHGRHPECKPCQKKKSRKMQRYLLYT